MAGPSGLEIVERAPEPASRDAAPGPPAALIFGVLLGVLTVSIGASALLLAGAGRMTASETTAVVSPIRADAPAETRPGQTAAPERVRVVSASGNARPTGGDAYEVTFRWMLEGARQSDPVVIHFYMGSTLLGEQRGSLEPGVFSFSSGAFTLTTEQECSTSGWSADLVTIRGVVVDGDGIAVVPGVRCQ